jgi:hypothetical protein
MPTESTRPDALMMNIQSQIKGSRSADRAASVCDIAEPLLGVDKANGEHAWIRQQPHGVLFVTRDIYDTINFPQDHPKSGQPRYQWEPESNGIRRGFLVDAAKPEGTA